MATMVAKFPGFSPAAFDFYEGLEADNSKTYWLENKPTFDVHVKGALQRLLDSFPAAYQPWHVFRPNRDVRFAKDKSPYKTQHGAVNETDRSMLHYVQLSGAGVMAASGAYMLASDQIERFRTAVAHDVHGPALEKILSALTKKGYRVEPGGSAPLKMTPRGYPNDHPRIERLRWKGCIAVLEILDEAAMTSPDVRDAILAFWKASAPLNIWLDTHVGPTDHEPDGR
jgi:uncharacterized protein (TIGR02453 family)